MIHKQQVIHLKDTVNELEIEKQRYKDDCNLAVRLLHRHPNEFIPTTPEHIQEQLKNKNESVSKFNKSCYVVPVQKNQWLIVNI